MVMRLAFSISMNVNAEILLIDEWLGVGDATFVEKAQERLNDQIEKVPLLVLASHSEKLLRRVCNKWYRLIHGKIESIIL